MSCLRDAGLFRLQGSALGGLPSTWGFPNPEGPSTPCLRSLVAKTIRLMVVGTGDLGYWALGISGKIRDPFLGVPIVKIIVSE